MVLFPDPEGPTIAVVEPAFILKFAFSSTFCILSLAVGYLKVTSLKVMDLSSSKSGWALSLSAMRETLSITAKTSFPTTLALITAWIFGVSYISIIIPV
jgi:hypothetical protein